jgi:hypothetical protein
MGYGDPYYGGGYGYGSPYGYGSSYYGNSYYGGLGYGYSPYGYAPYGWYNNYYYPGSGYYVYDNDRRARVMTDSERRYWMARIRAARTERATDGTRTVRTRENWSGFRNRTSARSSSTSVSEDTTTTQTNSRRRNRSRN